MGHLAFAHGTSGRQVDCPATIWVRKTVGKTQKWLSAAIANTHVGIPERKFMQALCYAPASCSGSFGGDQELFIEKGNMRRHQILQKGRRGGNRRGDGVCVPLTIVMSVQTLTELSIAACIEHNHALLGNA